MKILEPLMIGAWLAFLVVAALAAVFALAFVILVGSAWVADLANAVTR